MKLEKSIIRSLAVGLFLSTSFQVMAQVGISTLTTDTNSALDKQSIDKGVLTPRLTTV